jgi:hypothetical protein
LRVEQGGEIAAAAGSEDDDVAHVRIR